MVRVTLSNWGNGRAIRIPKQLREEAGLSDDERFEASVQADGSILLQPLRHDMRVIRVGSLADAFADYQGTFEAHEDGFSEPVGHEAL